MREYPTDEELKRFIEELEQQELYAPKHMKQQILSQAFPKQTVAELPKSGRRKASVSVLAYRLKIVAGMAAALLMLAVIPMQGASYDSVSGQEEWEQARLSEQEKMQERFFSEKSGMDVNAYLNDKMREANQKMNSWVRQDEER